MEENFDKFDEYVMKYDMKDHMIAYKYNHSYRVMHQAEEICRSLEMDTVERDLASFISLFHDIARFKQWTEYKTFNDSKSFDHGDEGEKILFEEGLINELNVSEEDYDVIRKAIRNHNKYHIEEGLNERELLHSKIVRDADKIDILYAFSTQRLLELKEDDTEISDAVNEDYFNHESTDCTNYKGKNDRLVGLFSLVFDINYDYSKQRILNENYIEKIYAGLKNKKLFKKYKDEAIKYLKGEI